MNLIIIIKVLHQNFYWYNKDIIHHYFDIYVDSRTKEENKVRQRKMLLYCSLSSKSSRTRCVVTATLSCTLFPLAAHYFFHQIFLISITATASFAMMVQLTPVCVSTMSVIVASSSSIIVMVSPWISPSVIIIPSTIAVVTSSISTVATSMK